MAGTVVMALALLMATDFAPVYTAMLQQAHFAIPKGVAQMSNLDTGGNLFNWLILKTCSINFLIYIVTNYI